MRVLIISSILIWFIISRTDGLSDEPPQQNSIPDGTSKSTFYPWLVSIWSTDDKICAGTILSENVVLTADSCFYATKSRSLVVRVSDGSSEHRVVEIIRSIHDIALLRVTPPFPCNNKHVRAIDLATKEEVVAPGTNTSVVDWKPTNKLDGSNSIAIDQCPDYFSAGVICVSVTNGRVGPGSYGGPLLKNGIQIGIIPWLFPSHPIPSQIVAISIPHYHAWLKKKVINLNPNKLKIGGGIKTPEHLWLVSIRSNVTHLCDGSIISKSVVLTAASCFGSQLPSGLTVMTDTIGPGSKHIVTDWKIHERYDSSSNVNDIALLKVSPQFQFNNYVSPISLVSNAGPYVRVEPCAWMDKILDTPSADTLSRCPRDISEEHVCLESLNGTVCQFTGGPLVNDGHLIGFKPKGRYCLTSDDTKIYNYALYHRDWISVNLQTLSQDDEGPSFWSKLWSYVSP